DSACRWRDGSSSCTADASLRRMRPTAGPCSASSCHAGRRSSMSEILVVDDEEGIRAFLADTLSTDGHHVAQAADGAAAIGELRGRPFDLLITDLRMPGALDGIDVVREAHNTRPEMPVIVLTAHGSVKTAVEAMKLGAHDYLEKPVSGPTELRILVSRALAAAN